jgi:HlyD family secretion protein
MTHIDDDPRHTVIEAYPQADAHAGAAAGPQGQALILELRRLQHALDHNWNADAPETAARSRQPKGERRSNASVKVKKTAKTPRRASPGRTLASYLDWLGFRSRPAVERRDAAPGRKPPQRRPAPPRPAPQAPPEAADMELPPSRDRVDPMPPVLRVSEFLEVRERQHRRNMPTDRRQDHPLDHPGDLPQNPTQNSLRDLAQDRRQALQDRESRRQDHPPDQPRDIPRNPHQDPAQDRRQALQDRDRSAAPEPVAAIAAPAPHVPVLTKDANALVSTSIAQLRAGAKFLVNASPGAAVAEIPGEAFSSRVGRAYLAELRTALRVLIVSGGVAGGWATLVPWSGAVVLPGTLVVESSVKKVQHPTGGVVADIAVRDGMHVDAGNLLVRLDETQVRASGQMLVNQLDQVRMRAARLIAERDGAPEIRIPDNFAARMSDAGIAQLVASEKSQFNARASARRGQTDLLQSNIGQFKEQIGGLEAQIASKTSQLSIIAGELTGVQELYGKGLVPLTRLTTLQREAARLEGERGQLTSAIAEAKAKIGQAQLQIVKVEQDFRTEVLKDLRETQDKESEFTEKNIAAQDQLQRIDIRAPTTGTIHQLSVHTIGGVIRAGDVILEIVPDSDDLEIEARLPPNEIDQVRRAQTAFMRFSAFNQRTTPQVEGAVSYVSADLAHDTQTNAAYYSVRVTLPGDERRRLGEVKLVAGMPVEVFLQTGSRTMMSYLLKPIADQFHRMFNER